MTGFSVAAPRLWNKIPCTGDKRKRFCDYESGPRFIKLKRYELVLIAHLHMRIVKIQRVAQSARILPIHGKEGVIRGKSTSFYILVSGRPRSRELRDLVSFQLGKTGP